MAMRIEGTIRPTRDGTGFDREAWCRLVSRRPEFRRYLPRQIRNPFTGKSVTIQPRADGAEVLKEGHPVGNVSWSESDEPLVCVSVEPSAMSLVLEWAKELAGEFHRESWKTDEAGAASDHGG